VDDLFPFLEVHGPDNQEFKIDLLKGRITIGRFCDFNDVGLEPDPQHLITRKAHCSIERDADGWWVVDNGSVNRTFLEREQSIEVVTSRTLLMDEDNIRILGRLTEDGEAVYWVLTFRDPLKTQPANHKASPSGDTYLKYDWIQAKLFCLNGAGRTEIINLRPQEHKLIRYMEHRNRTNGHVPVMCSYEELIEAVWGKDSSQTETNVTHLVWELRQKIEPNPKKPRFLQNIPKLGYRLVTYATD
jgi:hypothetical protein